MGSTENSLFIDLHQKVYKKKRTSYTEKSAFMVTNYLFEREIADWVRTFAAGSNDRSSISNFSL